MESIAINGKIRKDVGKKSTKAVRKAGEIPCVLYGGKEEIHFTTLAIEVKNLIYTGDFKLAQINIDGQSHKCILRDIQFHPVTDEVIHLDFLRLMEGQTIKVAIPVHFTGSSIGIRSGGKLMRKVRRVKLKTTPEYLISELSLDVTHLELGQSIRVRDINEMEGITILNSPGMPLATVEIPRALRSASSAAEEAGEEGEEGEEGEGAEGESTEGEGGEK